MDDENINVLKEIFWPAVFIASLSFIIAVFPRFIITFGWASDDFLSIYTGSIGFWDWLVALIIFASLVLGTTMVKHSENEVAPGNFFDKFALFLGRVTMLLVVGPTNLFAEKKISEIPFPASPLPVFIPPTTFDNVEASGEGSAKVDPPYQFHPLYQL